MPIAPNRYNKETISTYYKSVNLQNEFRFSPVSVDTVHKILTNTDITKSAWNDGVSGVFLKDGAEILASQFLNSATFQSQPHPSLIIANLQNFCHFIKRDAKQTQKNIDLSLFFF